MIDKEKVLNDAPNVLNNNNEGWEVSIKGDSIVAKWKWMDATFFSPEEINDEVKDYTFTVTLKNKGKYKEQDSTKNISKNISVNDGKIGLGGSFSSFKGNTNQKSFSIGFGKDNKTDDVGILVNKFDTDLVKKPIREYLKSCGWKKAGLFG
jgi:hypothetical protein